MAPLYTPPRARWSGRACCGFALLALFALPVLVSGGMFGRTKEVPWYLARRDPTGLAPDPATTPEAVIQVYAARAVSWRGVFAVHTWIVVKPAGAERFSRYEVLGFGVANGAPAVRIDRTRPRQLLVRRASGAGSRPSRAGPRPGHRKNPGGGGELPLPARIPRLAGAQ